MLPSAIAMIHDAITAMHETRCGGIPDSKAGQVKGLQRTNSVTVA